MFNSGTRYKTTQTLQLQYYPERPRSRHGSDDRCRNLTLSLPWFFLYILINTSSWFKYNSSMTWLQKWTILRGTCIWRLFHTPLVNWRIVQKIVLQTIYFQHLIHISMFSLFSVLHFDVLLQYLGQVFIALNCFGIYFCIYRFCPLNSRQIPITLISR